jgi:hypothetical protein
MYASSQQVGENEGIEMMPMYEPVSHSCHPVVKGGTGRTNQRC